MLPTDKELEEYKNSVFAYNKCSGDIKSLELQKQTETNLDWFFVIIWLILFYLISQVLIKINIAWVIVILFYGSMFLIGSSSKKKIAIINFLTNILTLGKSEKIKEKNEDLVKKIDQIKDKKEEVKKQIKKFEESTSKYYSNQLEDFFQNNLYNKRSGNKEFEKSLSEFSLTDSRNYQS